MIIWFDVAVKVHTLISAVELIVPLTFSPNWIDCAPRLDPGPCKREAVVKEFVAAIVMDAQLVSSILRQATLQKGSDDVCVSGFTRDIAPVRPIQLDHRITRHEGRLREECRYDLVRDAREFIIICLRYGLNPPEDVLAWNNAVCGAQAGEYEGNKPKRNRYNVSDHARQGPNDGVRYCRDS